MKKIAGWLMFAEMGSETPELALTDLYIQFIGDSADLPGRDVKGSGNGQCRRAHHPVLPGSGKKTFLHSNTLLIGECCFPHYFCQPRKKPLRRRGTAGKYLICLVGKMGRVSFCDAIRPRLLPWPNKALRPLPENRWCWPAEPGHDRFPQHWPLPPVPV